MVKRKLYIVHMEEILFEWDDRKDEANLRKHGIEFQEAVSAFYDEYAQVFYDPDHSESEDRFILLGLSLNLRTLVVCHCYRENERVIRIISARNADSAEERDYWRERS